MDQGFLPRSAFSTLLSELRLRGIHCVGPQVENDCIVYKSLDQVPALPTGIEIEQAAGRYTIHYTGTPRSFAWANGPQALKPILFAPRETLWSCQKDLQGSLEFLHSQADVHPTAVIGVRACDLAALALLDQHFLYGKHPDPWYRSRRQALLIIAVNCTHPSATCFCHSTGDGPEVRGPYDVLLDELEDGYIVRSGSTVGNELINSLPLQAVTREQKKLVEAQNTQAIKQQTRSLPSKNLYQSLFERLNHPHWQTVADRCLSCGNCTSVCPTCFCYHEIDEPTLDGSESKHVREWDSCFTQGHSYIHGYTVRTDTRLRYRQWLTHKLGSWHEQYGRSGCVGCGRCITWCPVGIDLTEEIPAILDSPDD